ncbi:hypothetical protein ACFQU7_33705 [Pseudoroseomonas wenyumeiae]
MRAPWAGWPEHGPAAGRRGGWCAGADGLFRTALYRLESVVGGLVSTAAALLVAAEIVLLFAGVLARYALHTPDLGG